MKNRKKNTKLILLVLLVCITLGYAALRTGLNINGTTNVSSASWNVYFSNYQMSNATNIDPVEEPEIVGTTTTSISYEVDLDVPGDIYEFSVEVVNSGSMDALISLVSKYNGSEIGPNNPVPAYITYTVTDENGDEIVDGHRLNHGDSEIVKVYVKYKEDASVLPSQDATLRFDIEIEATQAGKVNPPAVNDLYTVNTNEFVYMGHTMPSTITTYQTPAEAIAAFDNRPIYLRHTFTDASYWRACEIDGDYCDGTDYDSIEGCEEYIRESELINDYTCNEVHEVQKTYAGVLINETTKAQLKASICSGSSSCETAIDNLVNGTYYIDGANTNEDVYNNNINLIRTMYNYTVQDEVCGSYDYGYQCAIQELKIVLDYRGNSTVGASRGGCVVGDNPGAGSICSTY